MSKIQKIINEAICGSSIVFRERDGNVFLVDDQHQQLSHIACEENSTFSLDSLFAYLSEFKCKEGFVCTRFETSDVIYEGSIPVDVDVIAWDAIFLVDNYQEITLVETIDVASVAYERYQDRDSGTIWQHPIQEAAE